MNLPRIQLGKEFMSAWRNVKTQVQNYVVSAADSDRLSTSKCLRVSADNNEHRSSALRHVRLAGSNPAALDQLLDTRPLHPQPKLPRWFTDLLAGLAIGGFLVLLRMLNAF